MAQGDSEIAFHSSPVFLNSKKRLGNGGRFDQLNFFLKSKLHFTSSCAFKTAKYLESVLIIKFKFGCQSCTSVFPAKIVDLNNYKNQTIVSSEKPVGPRINVALSQIKISKYSKPSKGSAFYMLLTHREFYPLDHSQF